MADALPFGDHDDGVGILDAGIGVLENVTSRSISAALGMPTGSWARISAPKRWSVSISGTEGASRMSSVSALEGQAEHGDDLAVDVAADRVQFTLESHLALARVVGGNRLLDDAQRNAVWGDFSLGGRCRSSASVSLGKHEPP